MKKILVVLLAVIGFFACTKNMPYESEFGKSYKVFQDFKRSSGNSYVYVTTTSSWTGYSSKTTITVNSGKVIRRAFLSQFYSEKVPEQNGIKENWVEEQNELGTHESGFRAITLDAVYEMCRKDFLTVDPNANEVIFRAQNAGMISVCGYIPHGCADDCFQGVTIESITPVQ